MLHRWQLRGDHVQHLGRMVPTYKFTYEQQAERFLYRAAGTSVPHMQPARNNDDVNTANTSLVRLNGRLFANGRQARRSRWTKRRFALSALVTWRPDLAALPFSAHPLVDHDGALWNIGSIGVGAQRD